MNQTPASGVHTIETLLLFTLLQLIVIIVAARGAGYVSVRLKQPRAVGEIVAGLLLGPSLFGALAPTPFNWLFRSIDSTPLTLISQIGLILLMFQIGLEFDFSQLGTAVNRRVTLLVTSAGILLPFSLGFGFGQVSAAVLAPGISPLAYSLFIAIALSITAVPILGRILMEFGLTRSRLGVVTIAAAAANDAVGWVLLAVVAAISTDHFSGPAVIRQLTGLVMYLAVSWWVMRPLISRWLKRCPITAEHLPQDVLALLLALIFGSAIVTSQLGIFAIFGGFIAGVLLHRHHVLVRAWRARVEDLLMVFFLPIFFTYTGLRTDIGSLASGNLWGWCAGLILLAMAGKLVGCYWAARAGGLGRDEARCIAIMMNTRALMELIVINLGYDLGVLPRPVFTMLVLMAIASTLMTAPGLRLWLPAEERLRSGRS